MKDETLLPPNSFSDDELMGMAHGDNPAANAYRELLEFRRNAANGNPGQPVTVPDGLRLALSNAGIAAPESDEMLFATHEKYVQLLVNWVKDRKPFAAPKAPDGWIPLSERMPMQPLEFDAMGTLRFKENAIVRKMLDYSREHGYGLNEMALEDFTPDDRMQLMQLIGYSLSGYGELSFVTDESYNRAAAAAPKGV